MTIQDVLDEMILKPGTPADIFEAIGIPLSEWTEFVESIVSNYNPDVALTYLTAFCLVAGEMYGLRRKIN